MKSATVGNWTVNTTSIYTGTEDHSGYTTNAGDITIYSDGSDASIHAKNFYIDTAGVLTAAGVTIDGDFKTSATVGTTVGVHLSSSANELYFYADIDDHVTEYAALSFDVDDGSGKGVITGSANDFFSAWYAAGKSIAITGTVDNNGTYTVHSRASDYSWIKFTSTINGTDGTDAATFTVTGGVHKVVTLGTVNPWGDDTLAYIGSQYMDVNTTTMGLVVKASPASVIVGDYELGTIQSVNLGSGISVVAISRLGTTGVGIRAEGSLYAVYASGDIYGTGNCSCLSFTDRTPFYEGDALTELRKVKGKDGEIDHDSLPLFTQRVIKIKEEVKGKSEIVESSVKGRDIGATVSMLTVAIQQLANKVETLENRR